MNSGRGLDFNLYSEILQKIDEIGKLNHSVIQNIYTFSQNVKQINEQIQNSADLTLEEKMKLVDHHNNLWKHTNLKKMFIETTIDDYKRTFNKSNANDLSKYKVSIIIPIYNKEKWLHRSIESCINQTHKNIEIICVNDGSTDSSLAIIKEYAEKDERIKIVDQVNQKCVYARLNGFKVSTSDYFMSLDPDDWFEANHVENMLRLIVSLGVDIVEDDGWRDAFGVRVNHYNHIYYGCMLSATYEFDINNVQVREVYSTTTIHSVALKIYSKKVIDNGIEAWQSLRSINWGEDRLINFVLLPHATTIALVNLGGYHYEPNDDSLTRSNDDNYSYLLKMQLQTLNTPDALNNFVAMGARHKWFMHWWCEEFFYDEEKRNEFGVGALAGRWLYKFSQIVVGRLREENENLRALNKKLMNAGGVSRNSVAKRMRKLDKYNK